MKIRNINGTSDTKCKCGSWLKHWENFSGQAVPSFCPVSACLNKDLVGAHVQKGGSSTDQKWYIYPLCAHHNKHTVPHADNVGATQDENGAAANVALRTGWEVEHPWCRRARDTV